MGKILLNGEEVEFREGQSVIEVALEHGIEVPHYCWHPALSVVASCRICQVEIEGPAGRRVVTSCNTPCSDGLKVYTDTEAVNRHRAGNLEDLLANHPLDCPICDKAGECWLQDYAYEYGPAAGRYEFPRRKLEKRKPISEHVLLDQERCILCTRCVRFLDDYVGKPELAVVGRGARSVIDIFPGRPVENDYQGNLADICPVGALTLKEFRFRNRVWHLKSTESVCPLCSRGCSIVLDTREDELNRVRPRTNPEVNGYFICDEGRFGLLEEYHPADRITSCALGRDPAALPEVLDTFAERCRAGRLLVVASTQQTCEFLWTLRELLDGSTVLGEVDFAYPAPPREEGDGLLRTGEKAANARGLRLLGYRELDERALGAALEGAASVLLLDSRLDRLPDRPPHLLVWAVRSPLRDSADALIPGTTLAEKDGTLVNFQGRLQRVRRAMRRPEGVPDDFEVLRGLAERLGAPAVPRDPFAAFDGVAARLGLSDLTLSAIPRNGVPVEESAGEEARR